MSDIINAYILAARASEKGTDTMSTNLNETIRLFILNLPEIVELRKAVNTEPGDAEDFTDKQLRIIDNAIAVALEDFDFEYTVTNAVESMDLSDAIESTLEFGYLDLDRILGLDDKVEEKVDDKVSDLESKIADLEDRLDNASLDI